MGCWSSRKKSKKKKKMKSLILVWSVLINFHIVYGAFHRTHSVDTERDECSSLISSDLVNEIQSYQPIVNQIVGAALNSTFSNSTWNR